MKTWKQAVDQFDKTQRHISQLKPRLKLLNEVSEHVGDLPLTQIHDGTLAPVVRAWNARGLKPQTVRVYLTRVGRVLHLAAKRWRDENGEHWLPQSPPMLTFPSASSIRLTSAKPYPLSWEEQERLLRDMPHWTGS